MCGCGSNEDRDYRTCVRDTVPRTAIRAGCVVVVVVLGWVCRCVVHSWIGFRQNGSDSVLSRTAIFPQKEGRKREISKESARGSSLRETDV